MKPTPPPSKHPNYQAFGTQSFDEADRELRDCWWSRTPEERMEALEELRIRVYGEEALKAKAVRCYAGGKVGQEPDPKDFIYC